MQVIYFSITLTVTEKKSEVVLLDYEARLCMILINNIKDQLKLWEYA